MWQHFLSIFIPAKSNQYQARLARPAVWSALLLATAIINGGWFYSTSQTLRVKGDSTDLSASQIISLTNQARQEHHLSLLTENAKLTEAAFAKAQNMLTTGNFNHTYQTTQGDVNPWEFITATSYQYHYAGENLARNFTSAENVVTSWLNSPEHAANLLSANYQEIGVAVVEGSFPDQSHTVLVVQLLASPQPSGLTSPNQPTNYQATPLLYAPGQTLSLPIDYPLTLLLVTVSVLITVVIVLMVDLTYGRTKRQRMPRHLWRH